MDIVRIVAVVIVIAFGIIIGDPSPTSESNPPEGTCTNSGQPGHC